MKRALCLAFAASAACSGPAVPTKVGPPPGPTAVTTEPDLDQPDTSRPAPKPTAVRGRITIAGGLDARPEQRTGTVIMTWLGAARQAAMSTGQFELQDAVDLFTHLTVLGPVDLTAPDASAPFELPVKSGEIVITAVLDSQHAVFATLIGTGGDGNLIGQSQPITVPPEGTAGDVELAIIQKAYTAPESCNIKRATLVTLDAPEVAGSIHNPTKRRLCVIVPPSYAKAKKRRYPVIYNFPGWGGSDAEMMVEVPMLERNFTATREAILVQVDTSTKVGSSYLVDSPVNGDWDTYLTKRVIPAIDKKFRTIKSRDGRATAGHSTGGFGAVAFGLRHPDLIGVVTGSAPDGLDTGYYFFGDNGGTVLGWFMPLLRAEDASGGAGFFASWAADWSPDASNPRGYAWPVDPATGRENPDAADKWRAAGPSSWLADADKVAAMKVLSGNIFLAVGDSDEAGLTAPTRRFSEQLTKAGIENTLSVLPGGHLNIDGLAGGTLKFAVDHLAAPTK